jgi:tetratricopeptide (TPR) repeat protein
LATAALVVALGLGAAEGTLRLIGYGHSPAFFRQVQDAAGRRWWRENRWVTAPYFSPELVRYPQVIRLPVDKAPGTYRVFVLGSSAAMGDPEPAFSLARTLELLLRNAFPAVRFEVANAGITAVNSNVVRALARDCAGLQPDLFIVYEGNNEVIGPYGPGTVFSPFLGSATSIRLIQAVRATRTGQAFMAIVRRWGPYRDQMKDWGGMRMFLRSAIDRDDPRLATTRRLFRDNLIAIAQTGHDAGATVLVCTVLANQKDFAPFLSGHRPDLSEADRARWEALFADGRRAAAAKDDGTAEAKFRQALAIDDHYGELAFALGRLCLRQGRLAEAKGFFQEALDLDLLRFRIDSAENGIIRGLTGKAAGLEVVDLEAAAERESPQGIVGNEFLYEHVHLNFQGTYRLALQLYARVAADLARRGRIDPAAVLPEPLSYAEARRRLAYTAYEQAMIIKEMQSRLAGAPFATQSDNPEMRRRYDLSAAAADRLLARPGVREGLAALYEQDLALNPGDWLLERNAGMALVNLEKAAQGRAHLQRAVEIVPDDADTWFALATADRLLGDAAGSAAAFAAVRRLDPGYPGLPPR